MTMMKGHNHSPNQPKIPGTHLTSSRVPTALIYRPARSATQSGRRPRHWVLTFEPSTPQKIDPLMGWTTSADPYRAIRLTFPDAESAIAFAEERDWPYILRDGLAADGAKADAT